MKVELIAITRYLRGDGSPQELLEHAGRVCYRTEGHGDPAAFLQARVREGHESLIEHASATFEISGISRACSHQLVRHRLASYSQESQRYVDMSEPEYIVPTAISRDPDALEIWNRASASLAEAYRRLRERGVRKEDARFLLPNATATRIVVTMNFRSWRHFIQERALNRAAQWEIREVALEVLRVLHREAPAVFEDLYARAT